MLTLQIGILVETRREIIQKHNDIMKFYVKTRYQAPRVRDARLEVEGILCGSIVPQPEVDELHNMSESTEQSYFEL